MNVTLKDVAALAGVSPSAVSRTFTEGASVSTKTREKVEAAAETLGYRPNALAAGLTTGRTKLIGLVSDNLRNPIFLEVFDMFTRALQERGLRPLLINLADETDPDNSVRLLRQYSVDGVIVASSTLPVAFASAFDAAGLPVVHSFGRVSARPEVDIVSVDNVACGRLAAQVLADRGYRQVAFLGGPASATSSQDRFDGFSNEAKRLGLSVSHSYSTAYSFRSGQDAMQCLIDSAPLAEAYFCGDDILSIGAMSALNTAGLNVPGDIGILGLNDMEMSGWDSVSLSTIRQPIEKIVLSSVERVISLFDNEASAPVSELFECDFVERGTLKPILNR